MPSIDADDMADILSDWESATYTPKGYPHTSAKSSTIDGVFEEKFVETDNIAGKRPTFYTAFTNVSDVKEDAHLTHDGTHYLVKEWENDGYGMTLLILEEQDY